MQYLQTATSNNEGGVRQTLKSRREQQNAENAEREVSLLPQPKTCLCVHVCTQTRVLLRTHIYPCVLDGLHTGTQARTCAKMHNISHARSCNMPPCTERAHDHAYPTLAPMQASLAAAIEAVRQGYNENQLDTQVWAFSKSKHTMSTKPEP